jgi:alpha-amylase/alpha-mannosidase (GH57 family)
MAIFHALGLHMHQPPGNLWLLIEKEQWEAQQIIRCYERAARYAHRFSDVARLHVGFSGILLEQFRDPQIVDAYRRFVDIPAMLESYRTARNIELIGMGYYHPIFPLIPVEDWDEQLARGRQIVQDTFGRAPRGFWPPEMAFCMEMVPALKKAGYEYVVVDSVHVKPEGAPERPDLCAPYTASYGGASITVVPRDRDLSNAQESGLDAAWFAGEVTRKLGEVPAGGEDRLVTTWSDGENGGWFRQMDEGSGFFGHYFTPYMMRVQSGDYPVRPVHISEYIAGHPARQAASVRTGAWNVGSTSGYDFSQWAGSEAQRTAIREIFDVSAQYWSLKRQGRAAAQDVQEARRLVLESETSCYLFWGDSWIPKLYERTRAARERLKKAESTPG